jgi:hypothetical protein
MELEKCRTPGCTADRAPRGNTPMCLERGPGRLGSGRAYKDDKLAFVMGPMRAFERRFVRRGGD